MVGFGTKQAWLAVRSSDPAQVRDALGLSNLGPLSWRAGIDQVYVTDDRIALTPPLPGADGAQWTLVVGRWLFAGEPTWPSVDIAELSARLDTEVQYYGSHRTVDLHQWRRARGGDLVRAFGYLGETGEVIEWHGDPDAAELAAHLPSTVDDETTILVDERDVRSVAAAWSLDPMELTGRPAPGPLLAAAAP